MLNEQEVHQIVDHVQRHAEEILKDIGKIPEQWAPAFDGNEDFPHIDGGFAG
jgi:uncharacterized protein YecA (UPF0149 family)